jgi:UDP-N-acetylglucosamine acyltransferase
MPVHATAIVDPAARLGEGVEVGPYAVIEGDVEIGGGCRVGAHAVLHAGCRLERNVHVSPHAVLAGLPQDLGFRDLPSFLAIGEGTVVREYVSVHRSSREGGETRVGRDCLLMALSHLGHDCRLGEGVVVTSFAGLSGHVEVGDRVVIGGQAGFHQHVRIGRLAMVGGHSRVPKDIPPFMVTEGNPCRVRGLNVVGLRRAGVPTESRAALKAALRLLFRSRLPMRRAVAAVKARVPEDPYVEELLAFVAASRRGVTPGPRVAVPE